MSLALSDYGPSFVSAVQNEGKTDAERGKQFEAGLFNSQPGSNVLQPANKGPRTWRTIKALNANIVSDKDVQIQNWCDPPSSFSLPTSFLLQKRPLYIKKCPDPKDDTIVAKHKLRHTFPLTFESDGVVIAPSSIIPFALESKTVFIRYAPHLSAAGTSILPLILQEEPKGANYEPEKFKVVLDLIVNQFCPKHLTSTALHPTAPYTSLYAFQKLVNSSVHPCAGTFIMELARLFETDALAARDGNVNSFTYQLDTIFNLLTCLFSRPPQSLKSVAENPSLFPIALTPEGRVYLEPDHFARLSGSSAPNSAEDLISRSLANDSVIVANGLNEHAREIIARRHALSKWFLTISQPQDDIRTGSPSATVIHMLCTGRLVEAADILKSLGLPQLGLIVVQAGTLNAVANCRALLAKMQSVSLTLKDSAEYSDADTGAASARHLSSETQSIRDLLRASQRAQLNCIDIISLLANDFTVLRSYISYRLQLLQACLSLVPGLVYDAFQNYRSLLTNMQEFSAMKRDSYSSLIENVIKLYCGIYKTNQEAFFISISSEKHDYSPFIRFLVTFSLLGLGLGPMDSSERSKILTKFSVAASIQLTEAGLCEDAVVPLLCAANEVSSGVTLAIHISKAQECYLREFVLRYVRNVPDGDKLAALRNLCRKYGISKNLSTKAIDFYKCYHLDGEKAKMPYARPLDVLDPLNYI